MHEGMPEIGALRTANLPCRQDAPTTESDAERTSRAAAQRYSISASARPSNGSGTVRTASGMSLASTTGLGSQVRRQPILGSVIKFIRDTRAFLTYFIQFSHNSFQFTDCLIIVITTF